jgi:hypothetical protein
MGIKEKVKRRDKDKGRTESKGNQMVKIMTRKREK